MTKKDIKKEVLNQIQKKHIKPRPKWEFLLKKSALWTALTITLLLGAISTAITIFMIRSADFDLHHHFEGNFAIFLFKNLPYFWLILLLGFIFIAYYNFRHTEKGYRYNFSKIIAAVTGVALLVGILVFAFGIAEKIEHKLLNKMSFYKHIEHEHLLDKWLNPDEGKLAGKITEIEDDEEFELEDFEGFEWEVKIDDLEKSLALKEGMRVRIVGERIDEDTFEAEVIRPWKRNFLEGGRAPRPNGPRKGPGMFKVHKGHMPPR